MKYDVFGRPLEEEVPEIAEAQVIGEEQSLRSPEDVSDDLINLLNDSVSDPRDFTDQYNTELDERGELAFTAWLRELSDREGREISDDLYNYDLRGQFIDLQGQLPEPGHGPDTYKKPNHPTFSKESRYEGVDGFQGGIWGNDSFIPGESNLYRPEELQDYFGKYEQEMRLIDRRVNSEQTANIKSVIDQGDRYGKIMSDAEAWAIAGRKGQKNFGEVWREKVDLHGGDNVIGKSVALTLGATIGSRAAGIAGAKAGAALGSGGGFVGAVIGSVIGLAAGMGMNALATWWSKKGDRDVRSGLLRLQVDEYDDPADKERDETLVADWYNEKRINDMREDPTWFGFAAGTVLDMFPYIAEVATGTGAVKAGFRGAFGAVTKRAATEALETGALKLTKDQSKAVLTQAAQLVARGQAGSYDSAVAMGINHFLQKNAMEAFRKSGKLVALAGKVPAVLAVQQPRIWGELDERQLASIDVDKDGKFKFDRVTGGEAARKEAMAFVEAVTELYGADMARFAYKHSGLQAALRPVFGALSSKTAKLAGTKTALKKFFNETRLGQELTGKGEIMQTLYKSAGYNQPLEEFTEEYVSMTLSAIMGFDKDERGDLSYGANVVDKVFFPVLHLKESSAMLAAFAVLPGAAGAFGALRGDATKLELERAEKFVSFVQGKNILDLNEDPEAFDRLYQEFIETQDVQGALDAGDKKADQKPTGFFGFLKHVFTSKPKQAALHGVGSSAEGFYKAVTAEEKRLIKENSDLSQEEAREKAVHNTVGTLLVGHVILAGEGSRESFEAFLDEEGIQADSPIVALFETQTGTQGLRRVAVVKDKEKLSDESKEVLRKSTNIIYDETATGQPAETSRNVSIDRDVAFDAATAPEGEAREKAVKKLKQHVMKAMGVFGYATKKTGVSVVEMNKKADMLVAEIMRSMEVNPDQKIVFTNASFANALDKKAAEKLSRETGREIKAGKGAVFRAWNDKDTIYITPMITARSSTKQKNPDAVLEEERMEVSFKGENDSIALTPEADDALTALMDDFSEAASKYEEKSPEFEALNTEARILMDALVSQDIDPKRAFETFIEVIQSLYGKHALAVNETLGISPAEIASPQTLKMLEKAALVSFNEKSGLELDFTKKPAKAAVVTERTKGEGQKAVERYIKAPGKAIEEKEAAIEAIKANERSGPFQMDEEARAVGEAVLEVLMKNSTSRKKGKKKISEEIRSIHAAFPGVTYNVDVTGDVGSNEEDDSSGNDDEMNFDQQVDDWVGRIAIMGALVERHGKRYGTRLAIMLGKQKFFVDLMHGDAKKWNEFIAEDENKGDFLERELRSIAKENVLTRANFQSFAKFQASLHVVPVVTMTGDKNVYINTNRINLDREIDAHIRSIFERPMDANAFAAEIVAAALSESDDPRYELLADIFGVPEGILRDINANLKGDMISKAFAATVVGRAKAFENVTDENVDAFAAKLIEDFRRNIGELAGKETTGVFSMLMAGMPEEMRLDVQYNNVEGKKSAAIIGDSQINDITETIRKKFWDGNDIGNHTFKLDGIRERQVGSNPFTGEPTIAPAVEGGQLFGSDLEEVMLDIFEKDSDKDFYLHNLGRFGEKGRHVFVKAPRMSREKLEQEAARVHNELAQLPKTVRELFVDPASLVGTASDFELHYMINAFDIAPLLYGDLGAYVKKNSIETVFNIIKRASQILTDGVAYSETVNIIYIDDFRTERAEEAFDGMSALAPHMAADIAEDFGPELMRGEESADTFKGHMSYIEKDPEGKRPDARVLVKVNWSNLEMLSNTNDEWARVNAYVKKWNDANLNNRIDAVVLSSGAKFRGHAKMTSLGSAPNIVTAPAGSLVRSQWLNHENDVSHDGVIMKQRAAHMFAPAMPHGRKAMDLRNQVSLRRAKKDLKRRLGYDKLVGEKSPENIQLAVARGESLFDPRYSVFVADRSMGVILETLRPRMARVALQKIGEGSNLLKGYEQDEETGLMRMARVKMNIRGARYATAGFQTRGAAEKFIRDHRTQFMDMFMPDEDGMPSDQVLSHEITFDGEYGSWVIPGDLIEETRVPADNYTSHGFARLMEPATPEAWEKLNLSISSDGIRIAKGEDFDGDKGFVLMFYKLKSDDGTYHNIYNKGRKDSRPESMHSMMNRALNLEYLDWMQADTSVYYMPDTDAEGNPMDIPLDIYDDIVNESKEGSRTSLNMPADIAFHSTVNHGSRKAIGVSAVYNSLYSLLSGMAESTGGKKIRLNTEIKKKNFKGEEYTVPISDLSLGDLYIPSEISFKNYRSVKKLIGNLLNIIIDDPKDPRIYHLNLDATTASSAIFLMMTNIEGRIDRKGSATVTDMRDSDAVAQARKIMEFISSPAMRAYSEWRRKKTGKGSLLKALKPFSDNEIRFILALHEIQGALFNVTTVLDAPYKKPDGDAGYNRLRNAFLSIKTGFGGLMPVDQAEQIFGENSKNPAMALSHEAHRLIMKAYQGLPEGKLSTISGDLADSIFNDRTIHRKSILITSLLGKLPKRSDMDGTLRRSIEAMEEHKENLFVQKLEVFGPAGRQRIGINSIDRNARVEYSPVEIEAIKNAFNELPLDVQNDFISYIIISRDLKSTHFGGSYMDLISNEASKRMNDGVKDAIDLINSKEDNVYDVIDAISTRFVEADEQAEGQPDGVTVADIEAQDAGETIPEADQGEGIPEKFQAAESRDIGAVARAERGFSTIAPILKSKGYNDLKVSVLTTPLKSRDGSRVVAAKFHRKGPKAGTISLHPPTVGLTFSEKAWKSPKLEGVKPLTYDFKNVSEWTAFLLEHEFQHSHSARRDGESEAGYENRMNDAAMHNLGLVTDQAGPDQKTYNVDTIVSDFNSWAFNEAGGADTVKKKVTLRELNSRYKSMATAIAAAQRPLERLAAILRANRMMPDSLIESFAKSLGVPVKTVMEHVAYQEKLVQEAKSKEAITERAQYLFEKEWLDQLLTWENSSDIVDAPILPDRMLDVLRKAGILDGKTDGSMVHYKRMLERAKRIGSTDENAIGYGHKIGPDTQAKLRRLGISKPLVSLRTGFISLSETEAEALLLLDIADGINRISKTFPVITAMPGSLQAILLQTEDTHKQDLSSSTIALMNESKWMEAARNHMEQLLSKGQQLRTDRDLEIMNALVDHAAMIESLNNAERGGRLSPLLHNFRSRRSLNDTYAQIANMNLDEILMDAGVRNPEIITKRYLAGMSQARQLYASMLIDKKLGEDYSKTSQFQKLLRLANGVPTLSEMRSGKRELPPPRNTGTYNVMIIDAIDDAAGLMATRSTGTNAMQKGLLAATRAVRRFQRRSHVMHANMLRETGGAAWIDPATGKKIKATSDSKRMGRMFREALSILRETPPDQWEDAVIIESYDDAVPTKLSKIERKLMHAYISWIRNTHDVKDIQKELREELGIKMLEQFAQARGKKYPPMARIHLFRMTKHIFGNEDMRGMLFTGEQDRILEAYEADIAQRKGSGMRAMKAVELYEQWRKTNAPHLRGWNGGQAVQWLGQQFDAQREAVNDIAEMLDEQWLREWTKTGYVPHEFKEEEEWEKPFIGSPKTTTTHEFGRRFATYQIAALNGKLPQNLDSAWLFEKYSNDIALMMAQRATIGYMATVSDEDGLPMMLFSGIKKMGVISAKVADQLSERLKYAMEMIDPGFKWKRVPGQTGFARLQSMMDQVNPKELGYVEVENDFKQLESVWVKKGTPVKIANHILKKNKKFENKWAQKLFDWTISMNHLSKSMGIALSAFHPFALLESLIAIDGIHGRAGRGNLLLHPFRSRREMKKIYRKLILNPDFAAEWLDAGLDFEVNRAPEYEYDKLNKGIIGLANDMMHGNVISKGISLPLKGVGILKTKFDHALWEVMLPTIKMWSANRLYAEESAKLIAEGRDFSHQKLREDIAAYVNDSFGGQEWEQYTWANPHIRKWLHLLVFAPDWTLSAMNISGLTHIGPLNRMIGSPTSGFHSAQRMEKYWPAFALIVLMLIPNLLQALIYGAAKATGNDDEDDKLFAFDNEVGQKFSVDITPFTRMLGQKYGKTHKRRAYLRWGKQAYEVFEGWLGGPEEALSTAMGKSSTAVKLVMEQALGIYKPGWSTPWQGEDMLATLGQVDGKIWDGRIAGVIKKFLPMSIIPVLDEHFSPGTGKPTSFFAPARLGMSSYKAQTEIASVMRAYAEGTATAAMKGLPDYERNLDILVSEVLDAAEQNGYKRTKVFKQGIAQARMFYYKRFFEALEKNDQKAMNKHAEALVRLQTKYKNFEASVERRLETSERKLTGGKRKSLRTAWYQAMQEASRKR